MSKYIDKDELWERLRKSMVHHIVTNTLFNTIKAVIDRMPTIEVSEDCISRQAAIDALWKALYEYEDKTEKQFQESEDLDIRDWCVHRIFVQNMNDIDRQTLLDLPPQSGSKCADCTGGYCEEECMEDEEMATKSKMRIYKGRGYSDHVVNLYITVDMEGVATLHILTDHEDIWIPLRDIADLMREKWAEANDELPEL